MQNGRLRKDWSGVLEADDEESRPAGVPVVPERHRGNLRVVERQ